MRRSKRCEEGTSFALRSAGLGKVPSVEPLVPFADELRHVLGYEVKRLGNRRVARRTDEAVDEPVVWRKEDPHLEVPALALEVEPRIERRSSIDRRVPS